MLPPPASAGLLYQQEDDKLLRRMSVDAMVLDSPFADFIELVEEIAQKGRSHGVYLPGVVMNVAINMIKGSVENIAKFSIADLTPAKFAAKCSVPALFIAARDDDFISPWHSEKIYKLYAGAKNIAIVDGDHNSQRDNECLAIVASFLSKYLRPPARAKEDVYHGIAPWAASPFLCRVRGGASASDAFHIPPVQLAEHNMSAKRIGKGSALPLTRPAVRVNRTEQECSTSAHFQLAHAEDQAHYYCSRGNALEETGNMEGAIAAYMKAISHLPTYADARYNLGLAFKGTGQIDAAITEYEMAIKFKHDHTDAHNNLGVALEEKGDVERSLCCYRAAIKYEPSHIEAHCNLADALLSLGRLDEAVKEYQIAVSYNREDADAINNMGVALEAQGNVDAAIQAYTTAVAIQGKVDAQCNLADALHSRGQIDTAVSLYRLIATNNPKESSVHNSLGNALQAKGDVDEAIRVYNLALEHNKSDATTRNNLGKCLLLSITW